MDLREDLIIARWRAHLRVSQQMRQVFKYQSSSLSWHIIEKIRNSIKKGEQVSTVSRVFICIFISMYESRSTVDCRADLSVTLTDYRCDCCVSCQWWHKGSDMSSNIFWNSDSVIAIRTKKDYHTLCEMIWKNRRKRARAQSPSCTRMVNQKAVRPWRHAIHQSETCHANELN